MYGLPSGSDFRAAALFFFERIAEAHSTEQSEDFLYSGARV